MLNLPRPVQTLVGGAHLDPIDDRALAAHREQWRPLLGNEPDAPWDWDDYRQGIDTAYGAMLGGTLAHCALWSGQHLEALMIVSSPHICVDVIHAGAEALYIEFLASAPWHRKWLGLSLPAGAFPPRAGVGACLVNEAITSSRRLNMAGRLAWHSKASAVDKYRAMFHRACNRGPFECGTEISTGEVAMEIDARLAALWHYP